MKKWILNEFEIFRNLFSGQEKKIGPVIEDESGKMSKMSQNQRKAAFMEIAIFSCRIS